MHDSGDTAADAARRGDVTTLVELLDSGLDVQCRNTAGDTLLMLAAYHGHEAVVTLLLERGADPGAVNAEGAVQASRSPLMYAAMYNHAQLTGLLLEHGADPRRRDREGKTALDLAREMRAVHTLPLLEAATGDGGA
jgi:ankyrin repeat protein